MELSIVQKISRRVEGTGSAVEHQNLSNDQCWTLTERICSQEGPVAWNASQHSPDSCLAKRQLKICLMHSKRRPASDFLSLCAGTNRY